MIAGQNLVLWVILLWCQYSLQPIWGRKAGIIGPHIPRGYGDGCWFSLSALFTETALKFNIIAYLLVHFCFNVLADIVQCRCSIGLQAQASSLNRRPDYSAMTQSEAPEKAALCSDHKV